MFFGHAVCWVLADTLEAARLGALAVEVDYEPLPSVVTVREAIEAGSFQGGQPRLERGDVDAAFAAPSTCSAGSRPRRPGALLPRDPLLARPRRRGRPGLRPEQHPAPERDPGDRRARAGPGEPRRHGPVPADGRGLRGKGDAAARVRRHRGPRSRPDGAAGAAAPHPDPGPHHDRQAARFPRPVARRLRRHRPHPGAGCNPDLGRRLEPRPLGTRSRPGPLPRRQRVLDPEPEGQRPDRADAQDVPDRVPRVRRPPGDARHRGRPRPLRPTPRDRPRAAATAELLRGGSAHPVRPGGSSPGAGSSVLGAGARHRRGRGTLGRIAEFNAPTSTPSGRWP